MKTTTQMPHDCPTTDLTDAVWLDIADITIGKRHRKHLGDLDELAALIAELGLLQPIGVTTDKVLVFGERRLRACRDVLGWRTIPAWIVDLPSIHAGEIAENFHKPWTVSEMVEVADRLHSFDHGGDRRSDQVRTSELETLTVDSAAKKVGLGGKDAYYRAKTVLEHGVPELVEAMDREEITIAVAAKLAEEPPEDQSACLAAPLTPDRWTSGRIEKRLTRIRNRRKRRPNGDTQPVPNDSIRAFHCRFQELETIAGLAPESVHLIATDIPYGDDFLPEVEELATFASRLLVPGGTLIAYVGQHRLDEKLAALSKHLKYGWLPPSAWTGRGNPIRPLKMLSKSIALALYSKGDISPADRWTDLTLNHYCAKRWHEWERPLTEVRKHVRCFSSPGDLVVDPCAGSFTTAVACKQLGRRFVGCESVEARFAKGLERLNRLEQLGDGAEDDDRFSTPLFAIDALLDREDFQDAIWVPATGDTTIADFLRRQRHDVMSTGITVDDIAAFASKYDQVATVIARPPAEVAAKLLKAALAIATKRVALLMPLSFLPKERESALKRLSPLRYVYVFTNDFSLKLSAGDEDISRDEQCAWFVWEQGWDGPPQIEFFPPEVALLG